MTEPGMGDAHGRIAVIGGGISGLGTAWLASRRGWHVEVFEAEEQPGGVIQGSTLGDALGITADIGAEASLFRRPETAALCRELGLPLEHPDPSQRAQIHSAGRFHPIPTPSIMGVPAEPDQLTGLLTDTELRRLRQERVAPVAEDLTVGDFLEARVGPALVDRLVDPLLGGVYAGSAWRLSLEQTVPQLWQAAREGSSVLGLAQRLGARTDGAPVFMGLRGGMSRLIAALTERLPDRGARIRPGTRIDALVKQPEGWGLVVQGDPLPDRYDHIVLAMPSWAAAPLLRAHAPGAADRLTTIEWSSSGVITLLLDAAASPLTGSGFLVPASETRIVKASTYASRKWPWLRAAVPPGTELVRLSVGRFGDEPSLLDREDEPLADAAVEDFRRITGHKGRILAQQVKRWERSLPQYRPGHAGLTSAVDRELRALPGLHLAGSAYAGVGIPACLARASAVVAAIGHHQPPRR